MAYRKSVLLNGIRVVTEKVPQVHSVALGVCITRGSRDESPEENGLSHFIEHLFFKGTEKRSARDIAIEMDEIGGELNGFTTKEFTYYYARFLDEHLDKVWELIADILKNSKFDPAQIKLERNVILEEIKSFNDSPSDQALHLLSSCLFEPHSLSRSIMGPEENINKFNRESILKFQERHYRGPNIIIGASGNIEHNRLVELVGSSLEFEGKAESRIKNEFQKIAPKFKKLRKKDISQVHVALGTITIKYKNKLRYPWLILNTFLGGGMSSRLFQRLREKEALVYEITSFMELLSDTGAFAVYFVTDPRNVQIAIECIWDEFRKLNKNGLEFGELKRTKEHLKGNLMLSLESMTSHLMRLLSNEMHLNRNISLEETIKNIENVDEEVLRSIIKDYLIPEVYSISKVGPKV